MRGIARRAGVDPSLVLQHYGPSRAFSRWAVRPAADLTATDIPAHLAEVLTIRLHDLPPATRALMRSMLTSPEAAALMRDYLQERVTNLSGAMTGDDAEVRAALMVSSIMGITIARHFIDLPALQDVGDDVLAPLIAAWLTFTG